WNSPEVSNSRPFPACATASRGCCVARTLRLRRGAYREQKVPPVDQVLLAGLPLAPGHEVKLGTVRQGCQQPGITQAICVERATHVTRLKSGDTCSVGTGIPRHPIEGE